MKTLINTMKTEGFVKLFLMQFVFIFLIMMMGMLR